MSCAPYATLDDLGDRIPQVTLSDTSKPTSSTAQRFLNAAQSRLDSALSTLGYVVPVVEATSPGGFGQVKEAVCLLAGASVLYARANGVGGDATVASADRMMKQYDELMKSWQDRKSPYELADVPRTEDRIDKPQHALAGASAEFGDVESADSAPRCWMGQEF